MTKPSRVGLAGAALAATALATTGLSSTASSQGDTFTELPAGNIPPSVVPVSAAVAGHPNAPITVALSVSTDGKNGRVLVARAPTTPGATEREPVKLTVTVARGKQSTSYRAEEPLAENNLPNSPGSWWGIKFSQQNNPSPAKPKQVVVEITSSAGGSLPNSEYVVFNNNGGPANIPNSWSTEGPWVTTRHNGEPPRQRPSAQSASPQQRSQQQPAARLFSPIR